MTGSSKDGPPNKLAFLIRLLDHAVRAVPAARYFWGIVAASVTVAIISLLADLNRLTFVAMVAALGSMFVFYIFSRFEKSSDPVVKLLGYALLIVATLAFIFIIVTSAWLALTCAPRLMAYVYGVAEVCYGSNPPGPNNQTPAQPPTDKIRVMYMEYPGFKDVDPNGDALFSNLEDGNLFVSDIVFYCETQMGTGNYAVPLNYNLKKGLSNVSLKLLDTSPSIFINAMHRSFGTVIANTSGKISEKSILEAFSTNPRKCVSLRFMTANHPQFTRMADYYKRHSMKLAVMPIRAVMNIVADKGLELSIPISNVVATFGVTRDFGCRDSDWIME